MCVVPGFSNAFSQYLAFIKSPVLSAGGPIEIRHLDRWITPCPVVGLFLRNPLSSAKRDRTLAIDLSFERRHAHHNTLALPWILAASAKLAGLGVTPHPHLWLPL